MFRLAHSSTATKGTSTRIDIWIGQQDRFDRPAKKSAQPTKTEPTPFEAQITTGPMFVPAAIVVVSFDRNKDVPTDDTMLTGTRFKVLSATEFSAVRTRTISIDLVGNCELVVVPCTEHPWQPGKFHTVFSWGGPTDMVVIDELPIAENRVKDYSQVAGFWNESSAGGPPQEQTFRNNPCIELVLQRTTTADDSSDDEAPELVPMADGEVLPMKEASPKKRRASLEQRTREPLSIPVTISLRSLEFSTTSYNWITSSDASEPYGPPKDHSQV